MFSSNRVPLVNVAPQEQLGVLGYPGEGATKDLLAQQGRKGHRYVSVTLPCHQ